MFAGSISLSAKMIAWTFQCVLIQVKNYWHDADYIKVEVREVEV